MANFCRNCGKPIINEQQCACVSIQNKLIKVRSPLLDGNIRDLFVDIGITCKSFFKNPLQVIIKSAKNVNWMLSAFFVIMAIIFSTIYGLSYHSSYYPLRYFFKIFFMNIIKLGVFILSLYYFCKVFAKGKGDLLKIFSGVGVATIVLSVAYLVGIIFKYIFPSFASITISVAMIFIFLLSVFMVKDVENIKDDNLLMLISVISYAIYNVASFILTIAIK